MKYLMAIVTAAAISSASWVHAATETQAVSSPKCDLKKIKQLGGKAIVKAEKGSWEGSYNITLQTDQMTFDQLLQKLVKEKCF